MRTIERSSAFKRDYKREAKGQHRSTLDEELKLVNTLKTVTSRLVRKQFAKDLSQYYWKPVFWSRSYCVVSCGGAPL